MTCNGGSRFAGVDRAKRENRLRLFVIEDGKVLLLQAEQRFPALVRHNYVKRNGARGTLLLCDRALRRRRDLRRGCALGFELLLCEC